MKRFWMEGRSDMLRATRTPLSNRSPQGAFALLGMVTAILLATASLAGGASFSRVEILGRPGHGESSAFTLRGTIPREGYDGYVQLYLRSDATIASVNGYNVATGETFDAVHYENRGMHENGLDAIYTFIVPEGQDMIMEFTRPEPLQTTETDGNLISRFPYTAVADLPELAIGFAAPEGKGGVGDEVVLITTSDIGNRYYGKELKSVADEEALVVVVKFVEQSDADRAAEDAARITTVTVEETQTVREGWFTGKAWLWTVVAVLGVVVMASAFIVPRILRKRDDEIGYR